MDCKRKSSLLIHNMKVLLEKDSLKIALKDFIAKHVFYHLTFKELIFRRFLFHLLCLGRTLVLYCYELELFCSFSFISKNSLRKWFLRRNVESLGVSYTLCLPFLIIILLRVRVPNAWFSWLCWQEQEFFIWFSLKFSSKNR